MDSFGNEIKEVAVWLYQNREKQAYDWLQIHLGEIQTYLQRVLQKLENRHDADLNLEQIAQAAVITMRRILQFYQQGKILELADCIYYELLEFVKLEELYS